MNIGSLYLVKKCYWLLFPSKETADAADRFEHRIITYAVYVEPPPGGVSLLEHPALAASNSTYWSKRLNCEVTYFSPDCYIVFLEEEGKFKKILTSDGRIGWILFADHFNDCFEEVKTE